MKSQRINISEIRIDGGTQPRASIDNGIVAEYADQVEDGHDFPPVIVYFDGANGWLADGFHRYHAHKRAGVSTILADVRNGTQDDAILHSLGANSAHGLRRTNDDKRKAVQTALAHATFGQWSDSKIAKACGVSHTFVASVRNPEVAERQKANAEAHHERKVKGKAPKAELNSAPKAGKVELNSNFDPVSPIEDDGVEADEAELAALEAEDQKQIDILLRIADSDDKLKQALDENRLLLAKCRAAEAARDTAQRQAEQFRKDMLQWKRRAERAEKSLEAA